MSLHLGFEPHSWYMGFAIQKTEANNHPYPYIWQAYTDNGNTYTVDDLQAYTLKGLKQQIKQYRLNERERIERLYKGVIK